MENCFWGLEESSPCDIPSECAAIPVSAYRTIELAIVERCFSPVASLSPAIRRENSIKFHLFFGFETKMLSQKGKNQFQHLIVVIASKREENILSARKICQKKIHFMTESFHHFSGCCAVFSHFTEFSCRTISPFKIEFLCRRSRKSEPCWLTQKSGETPERCR